MMNEKRKFPEANRSLFELKLDGENFPNRKMEPLMYLEFEYI